MQYRMHIQAELMITVEASNPDEAHAKASQWVDDNRDDDDGFEVVTDQVTRTLAGPRVYVDDKAITGIADSW